MQNKELKRNTSTVQEVNVVIPPDGGFGWIVVIAAFASSFTVDGIAFSFSIALLPQLCEQLKLEATNASIISSVQLGLYYLFGPFACALINHYGFRAVGICGCVIAFGGMFIASNKLEFTVILIFYGVFGGIGLGMIYTAGIICVGYYFEKYRALATGIFVCGSSVGGICLPPLFARMSDGLEYTMRLQSYFILICVISSWLYRPLKPTQRVPLTQNIFDDLDRLKAPSRVEFNDFVQLYKTRSKSDSMVSIDLDDRSEESRHFPQISIISSRFFQISENEKRKRKCCPSSWLRNLCLSSQIHAPGHRDVISTGPLDRKDIFYSASVLNLPEYRMVVTDDSEEHRKNMLSHHISMILDPSRLHLSTQTADVPVPMLVFHENSETCCGISHLIHKALGNLFDISLLKSTVFCLLAAACFCYSLAWMTPYMYLPKRGEMNEIPESFTSWFTSFISIGNAVGRVSAGVLATLFSHINPCYLSGFMTIFAGIITIISAYFGTDDVIIQIVYCIVFGFFIAFLTALRPIVVVKILGLEKLTNATGLSAAVIGIALLSGIPISSSLFSKTGTLHVTFVWDGILFISSGVLVILAFHVYLWQERKKNKK